MKSELRARALIEEGIDRIALSRDIRLSHADLDRLVNRVVESVEILEAQTEDEDEDIFEDVDSGAVYYVVTDCEIGGKSVKEGQFIEVTSADVDEGIAVIDIFNEDGDIVEEDIEVPLNDLDALEDNDTLEEVEDDEDLDEVTEAKVIRGGKKVTISSKMQALKKKLAAKKTGSGVNKYTIKDGKIVKKSSEQIKADKAKAKTFAKRMKKFAKKRAKSLKKSRAMNEGVEIREMLVSEDFDVQSGNITMTLKESDSVFLSEGAMKVVRDGVTIVEGITVDEAFENECVNESLFIIVENGDIDDEEDEELLEGKKKVAEDVEKEPTEEETSEEIEEGKGKKTKDAVKECGKKADEESDPSEDPEEEFANESLTYVNGKGYVLVSESGERALGNRVRARAILMNEGKEINADMLDRASRGEKVAL